MHISRKSWIKICILVKVKSTNTYQIDKACRQASRQSKRIEFYVETYPKDAYVSNLLFLSIAILYKAKIWTQSSY